VLIETVKLAEDRSGDVVVRLYEAHGVPGTATIRPSFEAAAFFRTDLLERVIGTDDDDPCVRLRPFQIMTIRIPVRKDP